MKKFLLLSLIALWSCTRPAIKDSSDLVEPINALAPYFKSDSVHIFKANFEVYGKQLTGFLVAKRMADNSFRFVMAPSSGPTIFDAEFKNGRFHMVSALKQVNKKIIINLLDKDLRLLFFAPEDDDKACLSYLGHEYCRYKINGKVDRATFGPVQQPLVGITYTYDSTYFPSRTLLHHTTFQLDLILQPVKTE